MRQLATDNAISRSTGYACLHEGLCTWIVGRITAAALVILHIEHGRTT